MYFLPTGSDSPQTQSLRATFSAGGARTATLTVDVDDDVARDVVLTVRIEVYKPLSVISCLYIMCRFVKALSEGTITKHVYTVYVLCFTVDLVSRISQWI